VLLDDPGRVRSQIIGVVCQIKWFDFDRNLVETRKLIIRIPPGLGLNPLYISVLQSNTISEEAPYLLEASYFRQLSPLPVR
jgi:hypothetical protein